MKAALPEGKRWNPEAFLLKLKNQGEPEPAADLISQASTGDLGTAEVCDDADCYSLAEDVPEPFATGPRPHDASLPMLSPAAGIDEKIDPAAHKKDLRNLEKKLRQIEVLEQRQVAGLGLDKDAREKLSRKAHVERRLCELRMMIARDEGLSVASVGKRTHITAAEVVTTEVVSSWDRELADGLGTNSMHSEVEIKGNADQQCVAEAIPEVTLDNALDDVRMEGDVEDMSAPQTTYLAETCLQASLHEVADTEQPCTSHANSECRIEICKKELRSLEKKLRQIRALEERQHQGESLDTEAMSKIFRKPEMERQVRQLHQDLGISTEVQKLSPTEISGYSRNAMLRFWHDSLANAHMQEEDVAISGMNRLSAQNVDDHAQETCVSEAVREGPVDRERIFGTNMANAKHVKKDKKVAWKPSDSGYKIQKPTTHESEVERTVRNYASTIVSTRQSTIEYVCIRKWTPRPEDRDCIRLIQGERVVLESETLSGWGIGTVVPEAGESPRSGHFPRWSLSDNPAPEPIHFTPGTNAMVIHEFQAPASGYLSTHMNEVLVIKYQADPFVWVWAEDRADPNRRGWVPEAVLRLV